MKKIYSLSLCLIGNTLVDIKVGRHSEQSEEFP